MDSTICQTKFTIAFVSKLQSVSIKVIFFSRQHVQIFILPNDYPCLALCQ